MVLVEKKKTEGKNHSFLPSSSLLYCSCGFTAGQVQIVEEEGAGLGPDLNLCILT